MHHALLGMPADNLKSTDDLVHGAYVLSSNPPKEKKNSDCTYYHNTMRTLHSPLGLVTIYFTWGIEKKKCL